MQCRFPPTCQQENKGAQVCVTKHGGNNGCENLGGFAPLNPPLGVTDVQVLWVLSVQVGHDVRPPANSSVTANVWTGVWGRSRGGPYFLHCMAACFLLGSPIRIQCSVSLAGRAPL